MSNFDFRLNENVTREHVRDQNRYGIMTSGMMRSRRKYLLTP